MKHTRKNLNKQIPGVRDWKHGRAVIDEDVRIFQNIESFIKIQMRSGNGRLYTSLWKIKIIIVRPTMRSNGRAISPHF